jgi:hypothetical protein
VRAGVAKLRVRVFFALLLREDTTIAELPTKLFGIFGTYDRVPDCGVNSATVGQES